MVRHAWETRRWIFGVAALASAGLAAILILSGGAGGDEPPGPTVAGVEHERADVGDRASADTGCAGRAATCRSAARRSDRKRGRAEESGGQAAERGGGARARQAQDAAPAGEASVAVGEEPDRETPPNANPDHYGPGGEPATESTMTIGEGGPTKPGHPNVNPDHYGPQGPPDLEPAPAQEEGEPLRTDPPNVNPDE